MSIFEVEDFEDYDDCDDCDGLKIRFSRKFDFDDDDEENLPLLDALLDAGVAPSDIPLPHEFFASVSAGIDNVGRVNGGQVLSIPPFISTLPANTDPTALSAADGLDARLIDTLRKGSNRGRGKGHFDLEDFFDDVFDDKHDVFQFFQKHERIIADLPSIPVDGGDVPVVILPDVVGDFGCAADRRDCPQLVVDGGDPITTQSDEISPGHLAIAVIFIIAGDM